MQKSALRLALALGVFSGGCAGTQSEAALADLRTKLTDAQRKEADGRRRIDELENRVFLMTDQLESHKVAQAAVRPPRLPIVTLHPSEEGDADAGDPPHGDDVGFVGAARSSDAHHVRPVLRGDGDAGAIAAPARIARAPRSHAEPVRFDEPASDGLGVAPVPPIPKGAAPDRGKIAPMMERAQPDEEPLRAYRNAYGELAAGRYDEAEAQLRAFVKRYPHHDYADNAQYWLGECFYARHRYREAAVEFRAAVAKYPVGNKAPDALLKLAYSLLALGDGPEARRLLVELGASYPRSEAARLAAQKLEGLGASPKEESR